MSIITIMKTKDVVVRGYVNKLVNFRINKINVIFLNVVFFEFHSLRPKFLDFFDPFQIMKIVEVLKIKV